ncbi:HD domain-containing protein [Desertivirga arenae]|uniref:HD domain-containing protein n=1 Tax=Desertivirga arenae TaxID=2810309 RepID=UPI001A968E70|nr:hypothetical protein [Pedobacter sp. SYSU D00823]
MNNIKEVFLSMTSSYSDDESLMHELWSEIELAYKNSNRYYHNLGHLDNLFSLLNGVKELIEDFDLMVFSIIYHDVIYDPSSDKNEEQSAEFAAERLRRIGLVDERIYKCKKQILATKGHLTSSDSDTNLFTDADLSILGSDWDSYSAYYQNIRSEYSIFSDGIYYPGRKKVLKHFLQMAKIYKTDYFHHRFEEQARINLVRELKSL